MRQWIINLIFLIAAMLCFALAPGCQTREQEVSEKEKSVPEIPAIEKLSWVIGRWENVNGDKGVGERWVKLNATTLGGVGYSFERQDTTFTETLRIEQINSDIFYVADVPHNPGPVRFKLVQFDEHSAVFENPKHDFPNRIIYIRQGKDSLHVRIEGMGETEGRKADFRFVRN